MKLLALVTAGLVTAVAIAPTSVAAAPHGWRNKSVCKVMMRGHHKVRQCHQVRVRY
jgi:hypothetical protein